MSVDTAFLDGILVYKVVTGFSVSNQRAAGRDDGNMQAKAIRDWHAFARSRDPALLETLIAEDAVFQSPAVHAPQQGRALVIQYLTAAMEVLGNPSFQYVGEWTAERSAVLEFETTIDGVHVNGVDIVEWDDDDRIIRFRVMVRPIKALNKVIGLMAERLSRE